MKNQTGKFLESCRVTTGPMASDKSFEFNGQFRIPLSCTPGAVILVQCSDGGGWDHVSASFPDRCPTWDEMCEVKDLFFDEHEMVVQFHPPKIHHINNHPFCQHLWKCQRASFPAPPDLFVGVRKFNLPVPTDR